MIEFAATNPEVHVEPAEYLRLLGYPPGFVLSGRARELADWARQWYREQGRPWMYIRRAGEFEVSDAALRIDGVPFSSSRLRQSLQQAQADRVYLAAVGAGPEAEQEANRLWREEKPDAYFFLEIFASAVVEHLIAMAGARLCAWADGHDVAVLPHYSPGYAEWDITEQTSLLRVIQRHGALPGDLEALESGALRPKKSLLGVFGVTPFVERVRHLADLVPCQQCSLANCQYRREPYRRANRMGEAVALTPKQAPVAYTVNTKALRRWANERLSLQTDNNGAIHARFRYDGTTCTNMGRPLTFLYDVTLGPREQGHPILEQSCVPAPGDTGHRAMCQYIREPVEMLGTISGERPLAGMALDQVLTWHRASNPAGCYCDADSREHKWGLVLETIHYALHRQDDNGK